MFRAQQNPFDDAVIKATDENLTSENWEYIMDICDRVIAEENGSKDVVASMIKRLAHRNANVQLYTLELANSLNQNCGPKFHRELASRAFTDALLRLAADRNTHQQVKSKILEKMQEWAEMLQDPDFGIMKDQYLKLKSQNPNLHPPSAPIKSSLTDLDRQKEEEELQMALKLSIQQDKPEESNVQFKAASTTQLDQSNQLYQAPTEVATSKPLAPCTTAATVSRVRAIYNFQASEPDELTFVKGDVIAVLESVYKDWWKGLLRGQTGIFPLNYVEKLADPTPEEIQKEAQIEAEVFAEIKNVERLLTLLSTASPELNIQDNDEIGKLYFSTLAIRPKLIELISKYSQKKDEFTQLNERFIKSCRDYESLLDTSMTQNQPPYGQYTSHSPGRAYPTTSPTPQGPERFYSSNSLHNEPSYPQNPPSSQKFHPQRNGPLPFYVAPPGQQPSAETHGQIYPNSHQDTGSFDSLSALKPAPLQTSPPPTNSYPIPQPSQAPTQEYPQDGGYPVSPVDKESSTPQPRYSAYVPPHKPVYNQQQPSNEATTPFPNLHPPPALTAGYPVSNQSTESLGAWKPLTNQVPFNPYQRPASIPNHPSTGLPEDPSNFYRLSEAP
ncbi:unnamed protein product [Blumeria hordei]|uniref:Class E vacuolar protein-sorting machinery protein HSE1 n=2 Tax=Blumeria hordei TaxID=2867405 RepID=A0A383V3N9_BLUHO|nr:Class E vacuolar protein-sorting machinery protein HSE1/hypothetical protein [Blumeria hordei DH14]SZF06250.1 unnamed protein product [Blumeria hordei]